MIRLFVTITIVAFSSILLLSVVGNYADGGSIVGNYAEGYELGKEYGKNDYRSGNYHNSKCPPNDSLSWCTGYKIGYEAGWIAAQTLGGR